MQIIHSVHTLFLGREKGEETCFDKSRLVFILWSVWWKPTIICC